MSSRGRAVLLIALGTSLFAISIVGWVGDSFGLVLSYRWMEHPLLIGGPAMALVSLGCVLLAPTPVRRLLVAAAGGGVTLAWCALAASYAAFGPTVDDRNSYLANEDGSLRTMVMIGGIVDPIWEIRIEQHGRWLNHWHTVGCTGSLNRLSWHDGDLVVHTEYGQIVVPIDHDGRPGKAIGDEAAGQDLSRC